VAERIPALTIILFRRATTIAFQGNLTMPMTQIILRTGKAPAYRRAIADGVQKALTESIGVPSHERFCVITETDKDNFVFDPSFPNIARSEDLVMITITLKAGRSDALKQLLYQAIVAELGRNPRIRPQDVLIILHENGPADWSFGNGVAQLQV
jgi:4-oxalocrotonate tautomerase